MSRTIRITILTFIFALFAATFAAAQSSAPIPKQILTAKTVFISNGGSRLEKVSETLLYADFYDAVRSLGKYELVTAPADAELVFEISYSEPPSDATNGTSYVKPQLRLVIFDTKTHMKLWTITEFSRPNPGKGYDKAISNLMDTLKRLSFPVAVQEAKPPAEKKPPRKLW